MAGEMSVYRTNGLGLSRREVRQVGSQLAAIEVQGQLDLARIDREASLQAARVHSVAFVGKLALHAAAMVSETEQQLARVVPEAQGRLAAIGDLTAMSLAQVVTDTVGKVNR